MRLWRKVFEGEAETPGPLSQPPRKIILVRRDNIGDLVCTTPALYALRQAFPAAELALLVNTYNASLLAGHPDLNRIYVVEKPKHAPGRARGAVLWENFRVFRQIRRQRYDLALGCGSFTPTLAHYTFFTGAAARLGYVRTPGGFPWYTHPLLETPEPLHEVERVFRLLKPLGVAGEPGDLRLFPDLQEVARFQGFKAARLAGLGKPLVAVAISARIKNNRWPVERFGELIQCLLADGRLAVLLLWAPGSQASPTFPGDDEAAAGLIRRFGSAILAYPTPRLPALVAALFGSDLVVTLDTGSLHLAAAARKPTVALMTAGKVPGWRPWRTPCQVLTASARVSDIPATQVLEAVRELHAAYWS